MIRCSASKSVTWFHVMLFYFKHFVTLSRWWKEMLLANCRQSSMRMSYLVLLSGRPGILQPNKCHCTHLELKETFQIICIFDITADDSKNLHQRNGSRHKTIHLMTLQLNMKMFWSSLKFVSNLFTYIYTHEYLNEHKITMLYTDIDRQIDR